MWLTLLKQVPDLIVLCTFKKFVSLQEFMKRIGLLSDTHGYVHPQLPRIFQDCDEIWHAGDMGTLQTAQQLQAIKPFRGVHGNIDNQHIRSLFPEMLRFDCENVDVMITHIGGYPGKYEKKIREVLEQKPPALFISGHSHILKVMFDKKYKLLHINPGAAGKTGLHRVKTIVRFTIDGNNIKDLEVVELGS